MNSITGKKMPLYLMVTSDRFRLPIAVADSMEELSQMVGVSVTSISHAINNVKQGKRKKSKYEVVFVERGGIW